MVQEYKGDKAQEYKGDMVQEYKGDMAQEGTAVAHRMGSQP